jgi:Mn2+/Fe2+ NRAMP family transporter
MFVRAMALIPRRLAVIDVLRQADAMPSWYLWLLAIIAPLAIVGSGQWCFAGASIAKQLLGLAGIALYGTIMAQAIYGLIHRWQVS